MNVQNLTIASPKEALPRIASPDLVMSASSTRVVDLLGAIAKMRPDLPVAMLTTTATHFSTYVGVLLPDLKIATLQPAMQGFGSFLAKLTSRKGKPLSRNSVRSYKNYALLLRRLAVDLLGWSAEPSKAEAKWQEALAGIKLLDGCSGIVRFAVAAEKAPGQLSDDHLLAFKELKIANGRHPKSVQAVLGNFRRMIVQNKLRDKFPLITHPLDDYLYGVATADMPEPCRTQLRDMIASRLNTATRRLQKGSRRDTGKSSRRENENLRPETAINVERAVSKLLGYGVLKHLLDLQGPVDLLEVVHPRIVDPYISWQLDERKVTPNSLYSNLATLRGTLRKYPAYQTIDFDWMTDLMNTIPVEDEEAAIDRKSEYFIEHRVLCEIPLKIEKERSRVQRGTIKYARLTHDILLTHWMAVFAWRQFNVRICNLGTSKDCANIFKAGFDPNRPIGKPDDVEAELARNPGAEFWQIFFPKEQVKTKQMVRGIVPLYLVPLLEDYVTNQRPLLIRAALISTADRGTLFVDRGTLFLNHEGSPYTRLAFGNLIGGLTMKHAGRWGHPHLYRDALAFRWLDTHPEDYLSLSKHLWHRNINTTIRRYGRNFDESHGLKKVGGWVGTLFTS
jgi:hypothetical protein